MYTDVVKNLRATFPFLKAYMFHFLENKVVLMYTQDAQVHDNLIDDIALQNSLRHDIKALLEVDHLLFFAGLVRETSSDIWENQEAVNGKLKYIGGIIDQDRRKDLHKHFLKIINVVAKPVSERLSKMVLKILDTQSEMLTPPTQPITIIEFRNQELIMIQYYSENYCNNLQDVKLRFDSFYRNVVYIIKEFLNKQHNPLVFFAETNETQFFMPKLINQAILITDEARSDLAIISDVQFGVKVIRFD